MALPVLLMIEASFIGHDQCAEMQVVVVEEVVDAVQVELQLGRTHLGPLDLEIARQLVPGLDFTQALGDL
ncbi:hypothetical protein D3C84_1181920 [compost metagenome]